MLCYVTYVYNFIRCNWRIQYSKGLTFEIKYFLSYLVCFFQKRSIAVILWNYLSLKFTNNKINYCFWENYSSIWNLISKEQHMASKSERTAFRRSILPEYYQTFFFYVYPTQLFDRGSFDQKSVDRNFHFSVDRNFHNQLTKILNAFQLIEKFDQLPKKNWRILAVDQNFNNGILSF
jgi:hypothetical protein